MRAGGGKQKGSQFERDVCVALSLWVSKGRRRDCFWRSAMSGGRATVHRARGLSAETQAGDISAVHSSGHALTDLFCIECKHVRDVRFDLFLFGGGPTEKYWRQANAAAKAYRKRPMLIIKNRAGVYAVMHRLDATLLVDAGTPCTVVAHISGDSEPFSIFDFQTLMDTPCLLAVRPRVRMMR